MPSDIVQQAPERLELDRFLPYKLSVLNNRISEAIARQYAERFALTPSEWRVMAALGHTPGLSARAVAEKTAMDKVQVSRAVSSLADAGRLSRKPDELDGRITRLSLSARGRVIYDEIVPMALSLEAQLLSALSERERSALDAIMTKLTRQIDTLDR
jgi:DNA-binding MarR family transcriptional regulator